MWHCHRHSLADGANMCSLHVHCVGHWPCSASLCVSVLSDHLQGFCWRIGLCTASYRQLHWIYGSILFIGLLSVHLVVGMYLLYIHSPSQPWIPLAEVNDPVTKVLKLPSPQWKGSCLSHLCRPQTSNSNNSTTQNCIIIPYSFTLSSYTVTVM